jgi:hypothetical protein
MAAVIMNLRTRHFRFERAPALLVASWAAFAILCAPDLALAQQAKKSTWKVPRTEFGQPDLQGNWNNATLTQFERPANFGNRLVMTPDEAAQVEGSAAKHVADNAKPTDPKLGIQDLPKDCGYGFTGTNCGYNNFWVDRGTQVIRINGEPRTSIVTDPPNGRMPALTADAQRRNAARMGARRGFGPLDGPEARGLGERCIMSFGSSAGPPMLPLMYNNTYSIAQSKDTVMIVVEMVHDVRIVRLNGERLPRSVRKWMGDSIGHWEGDTLVIETENFHPLHGYRGANENLKITERLTRVAPDQIIYKFTIEDPTTFTQSISGELPMNFTRDLQFEYACHEGNYALPGILAGAREEERAAAAAGKTVALRRSAAQDEEGEK